MPAAAADCTPLNIRKVVDSREGRERGATETEGREPERKHYSTDWMMHILVLGVHPHDKAHKAVHNT